MKLSCDYEDIYLFTINRQSHLCLSSLKTFTPSPSFLWSFCTFAIHAFRVIVEGVFADMGLIVFMKSTYYASELLGKSDWFRAFNQYTMASEVDII